MKTDVRVNWVLIAEVGHALEPAIKGFLEKRPDVSEHEVFLALSGVSGAGLAFAGIKIFPETVTAVGEAFKKCHESVALMRAAEQALDTAALVAAPTEGKPN